MGFSKRKTILVLSMYPAGLAGIKGANAAAVPHATPDVANTAAVATSMPSSIPTAFTSTSTTSTATSIPDYINWATEAPVPTAAPEFNDEIVAAAITIPIPVISLQTYSINPTLHISENFDHQHDTSKVTKEDSSWRMDGVKVVPGNGADPWKGTPGADTKGSSVKVANGPDANGYVPPAYNGHIHGTELPNFVVKEDATNLVPRAEAAEGEAPSGWKILKDLYGPKDPQTVSTGQRGNPPPQRQSYKEIDRAEDNNIPSVFGGDEEGHIDAKNINPVSGSSSVTTKDGYKISEGNSVVETNSHGDTETASYTGLGVAEYNKVKSILDYFHHGKKPLTLAAAMEVAAAEESGNVPPSFEETPFEELNKTSSKQIPRSLAERNKTDTALGIVKKMMEEPAAKHNLLKKVLEVVYGQLNKTSPIDTRGITKHMMETIIENNGTNIVKKIMEVPVQDNKDNKAKRFIVKHMWEAPVALPTTLLTATRPQTVNDAPTPTSTAEFYPIEDYYHRYMKRAGEEGVTFTLHAHVAAKTYASSWATATQDHSSHTETFPHDDDAAHYNDSKKKSDWDMDNLEDSPVFDDPNEDHETNIETHDELRDLQDEAKDMSQEIDDEFKDEFGSSRQ